MTSRESAGSDCSGGGADVEVLGGGGGGGGAPKFRNGDGPGPLLGMLTLSAADGALESAACWWRASAGPAARRRMRTSRPGSRSCPPSRTKQSSARSRDGAPGATTGARDFVPRFSSPTCSFTFTARLRPALRRRLRRPGLLLSVVMSAPMPAHGWRTVSGHYSRALCWTTCRCGAGGARRDARRERIDVRREVLVLVDERVVLSARRRHFTVDLCGVAKDVRLARRGRGGRGGARESIRPSAAARPGAHLRVRVAER